MKLRLHRIVILLCAIVLLPTFFVRAEIKIESDYLPELLRYEITVERLRNPNDRLPISHPVIPFKIAHSPTDSIITIYAYNGGGIRNDPANVGVRDYRNGVTLDDNPLDGTITQLELYRDDGLGKQAVAVAYRRNDSAFIARFIPMRDGFDEVFLVSRSGQSAEKWVPDVTISGVFDYDFDGTDEVFVHVNPGRGGVPNRLVCVELSRLQIEWQLDVAGSILPGNMVDCRDSANPGVLFATYNPKHGIVSGTFSDFYCELARVGKNGSILFQYVLSLEHGGVHLTPLINDSVFVTSHSTWKTDSSQTLDIRDTCSFLSLVTTSGQRLKSVDIDGHVHQVWLDDFDGNGVQNVYALSGDGDMHVFDLALEMIDSTGPSNLTNYVGRLSLPGLNPDATVFLNDTCGIVYDRDFNIVAVLPRLNRIYTLEYDAAGKAVLYLISGGGSATYFSMKEKGVWQRLHLWLIKNENYVLGVLVVLLILVVVSLIAHQRTAEQLRVNERRAAATVKSTPDYILRVSREGEYLDVHGSELGTLPAANLDVVGKKVWEVVNPELADYLMKVMRRVLDNQRMEVIEYDSERNGIRRWYRAHVVPAGKDEIVATLRDVSNEHKALDELKKSEARFRTLIESSPAAVMMHVDNKIIFANKALEEITGYSIEEILTMSPVDLVCDEYKQPVISRIKARREGFDFTQLFEVEALRKSGERRWVAYRAAVVSFDSEEAIMVIIHDISHRKRAEEQYAAIQRQQFDRIRQVAGGFAHEIYNSLYPVRTSIEQLSRLLTQDGPLDVARIERLLSLSDSAINRAVGLTELVSNYSKIEVPKSVSTIVVAKLVEEVAQQNARKLEDKLITLKTDIPDDLVLHCSSDQIYSVVNNLVINAIDAINSHRDGVILISARPDREGITISISDTGCGMTDEVRERIFDPFYSTKPRTGTGLGLAVVRRIVDICGGDISVKSTIDKGTDFYVYFPQHTG